MPNSPLLKDSPGTNPFGGSPITLQSNCNNRLIERKDMNGQLCPLLQGLYFDLGKRYSVKPGRGLTEECSEGENRLKMVSTEMCWVFNQMPN